MIKLRAASAACAGLLVCASAWSAPVPMSDADLSEVSGQALLSLTNSSLNGVDFTRIAVDADMTLNANLGDIQLGNYSYPARQGTGADISISALQFGRSDGTAAQQLVHISNPYLEVAYKNIGDSSNREIVGFRLGFDGISGDIGTKINSLSGSVLISAGAQTIDSHNDTVGNGKRWDGSCTGCITYSQVGGITAGDASGPSRDFWVSVQKVAVQYPAASNGVLPDIAQAGFWLNWRDKLTAINTTGQLPPNLPH